MNINIVVATYFPEGIDGEIREHGFLDSVESWQRNFVYDGDLHIIETHDGIKTFSSRKHSVFAHARKGIGASLNQGFGLAFIDSPLALNIVDDAVLAQPYDLTPWAHMLMDDEAIGAVHLSFPYPGCTGTIEPRKHGWVVRMNRHNLVAGLRPCLYHKRFFDAYGWFDEGLSAWETERLFNDRFCQSQGPESVLALPLPWTEGKGSGVLLGDKSPSWEPKIVDGILMTEKS